MGREHSKVVKHPGIVKEVRDKYLLVSIMNQSACSTCHAKGACTISDMQEKEIEITEFNQSYSPGQRVTILFKESSGFNALFLGYILPFIILFITLVVSLQLTKDEGLSGLASLLIFNTILYNIIFFSSSFKKNFQIRNRRI